MDPEDNTWYWSFGNWFCVRHRFLVCQECGSPPVDPPPEARFETRCMKCLAYQASSNYLCERCGARLPIDSSGNEPRRVALGERSLLDEAIAAAPGTADAADSGYVRAISAASCLMAQEILAKTTSAERSTKMRAVIDRKHTGVRFLLGLTADEPLGLSDIVRSCASGWDESRLITFLIDLEFTDPFAPYSLKYSRGAFDNALAGIATLIGKPSAAAEIRTARRDAMRAHDKRSLVKISMYGLAGAAVIAAGGWVAAPVVAGALGSVAGLTGAAATAHGLALLGGGSLAAGGLGMAGGMWMVAATGAGFGLLGGAGSRAMFELGVAQARMELVKLQVVFKLTVLGRQVEDRKAQQIVGGLQERARELDQALEEERLLNDSNSRRVNDLAEKLEAVEKTIRWMQSEGHQARAG